MLHHTWSRALRIVVLMVILSITWLQLNLRSLPHEPQNAESLEPDPSILLQQNPVAKFLKTISFNTIASEEKKLTPDEILEIQEQINLKSQNETIYNEEVFGPINSDTIVIVVQVHNRLEYLRHLIVSLAQARYVENVLLIFSHDFYSEDINKLVTTIDFCKVMQIFYPHSLQTHPHTFPGESENDCPRDTSASLAKMMQCAGNPDLYGHYREARYAQTKNHWWWKANRVFNDLWVLKNHSGLVLFLEEDHYVSEDFLHLLFMLRKALPQACPKCSIITLGNYRKNYNYVSESKKVEISQWMSSNHNMGFAFNRSAWNQMKRCGLQFCNHDDYNWDWSLQHISLSCLPQKLFTLAVRAPRVFHIGECGVHHQKKDCSSKILLNKVHQKLNYAQRVLFPSQLVIVYTQMKKTTKKHKGNGGWGDERDHALCRSFLVDSSPESPLAARLIPDPFATHTKEEPSQDEKDTPSAISNDLTKS